MTSNRPFRKAISEEEAIEKIRELASRGAYNPTLVETFFAAVHNKNNDPDG